jgi:hypothetical protein
MVATTIGPPPAPTPGSLDRTVLISEYDVQVLLHHMASASLARSAAIQAIRSGEACMALASLVSIEASLSRMAEATGRMSGAATGQMGPSGSCSDVPDWGDGDAITIGDIALVRETAATVLRNWVQRDATAAFGGRWTLADIEWLGGAIRILQTQQAMIRSHCAGSTPAAPTLVSA